MRILFCTNSIGAKGGIEKTVIAKANAFAEIDGNEVAICYTDKGTYPDDLIHPLSDRVNVIDLGVSFWDLHPLNLKNLLFNVPIKILRLRKAIKKAILDFRPDIVITTGSYEKYGLASINPSNLLKKPSVKIREFHFNSTYRSFLPERSWIIDIAEKFDFKVLCKLFDKNYLLTREDMETNFNGRRNFDYMYNPVHISQLPRLPIPERDKAVIVLCRLADQKNVHAIIRSWAAIRDDVQEWVLRIVGDGDQRTELENLAEALGISKNVEFLGFRKNVPEILRGCRIMAMTSKYEGFMNSMIEAIAQGTVPVAYRTPYGPTDLITDGADGVLVDYMNEKQFADKLKDLILSPDKLEAMSKAAVTRAKDFRFDKIIAQWMEKYEELLKQKGANR